MTWSSTSQQMAYLLATSRRGTSRQRTEPRSKRNTLTVTDGETLTWRHWKALFPISPSWRKTGKPMKNTDSERNIKILYCGSLIGAKITYSLKKSLERLEFYKVVPDVGLSISEQLSVFKRLSLENKAQQAIFYWAKGNRSLSSYCVSSSQKS